MHNKCKKIAVLCQYEFPVGLASSARIIAYCSGLKANGVSPEIHTFRWIPDNAGIPIEGVVNGIPYKNSHLWHANRCKLYKMLIDKPKVNKGAILNIIQSDKLQHIDWVLISFDTIPLLEYFVPKLKAAGLRLAFIGDEFPKPMRDELKENISPKQIKLYKKIYEYIDARIVMTKSLQDFYDNTVGPKPTYILPSIIHADRFKNEVSRSERIKSNYLCYMGGLDPTSDNLDVMIRAFAKVLLVYPSLELRLYGAPSPKNKKLFSDVAVQEGIADKVLFMGRVSSEEVPSILSNAKIVMTSQPDNMRIRGSFSTKIGEYLASGTPTLATKVGSIPLYFEHDKNIFFAAVDDVDDYANQIQYILSDYHHAMDVADCGRQYINDYFSAEYLTNGLISFLETL